jgi:hypothetical protein
MTDSSDKTGQHFSRRGILRAGAAAVAGIGLAGSAAAEPMQLAQDSQKVAQNLVQYQQMPKDGNKCSMCVNWVAPNQCKVVAGVINPNGWCVAFAPKTS